MKECKHAWLHFFFDMSVNFVSIIMKEKEKILDSIRRLVNRELLGWNYKCTCANVESNV